MSIDFKAYRPFVIAGPCSAETEDQVVGTALRPSPNKASRTSTAPASGSRALRPNSFEGVGTPGLKWLRRVKQETGLPVTTEVANKLHVYEALKYGIDVLWIGARTTVKPV